MTPLKGHPVKVQVLSDKNDNPKLTNSNSKKASYCGECGKKIRTLSHTKSGMPVCTECHTRYSNKQPKLLHSSTTKPKDSSQTIETQNINGGSLLEGTYDEEANAAAFAEALAEWRGGGNGYIRSKADGGDQLVSESTTSCQTMTSTETNTICHPSTVNVCTSRSISYLERLMIRRNRYDPKFLRNTVAPNHTMSNKPAISSSTVTDTQDDPVEPSPYNVFYEAPYLQKAVVQNSGDVTTFTNGATASHEVSCDPTVPVQLNAMQVAIKEAWTSNEAAGNLAQFFLSGVKEKTDTVVVGTQHKKDEQEKGTLTKTTGTWQPELSTTNDITVSQTEEHCASDSDNDTVLNIDDCESDNEEWELDDKMTLECLERELQASQLGWQVDQQEYLHNCDSDFEDIEKQLRKDEQ